jgi:hypothetical protein
MKKRFRILSFLIFATIVMIKILTAENARNFRLP